MGPQLAVEVHIEAVHTAGHNATVGHAGTSRSTTASQDCMGVNPHVDTNSTAKIGGESTEVPDRAGIDAEGRPIVGVSVLRRDVGTAGRMVGMPGAIVVAR